MVRIGVARATLALVCAAVGCVSGSAPATGPGGPSQLRRLSVREYSATVEDLTGVRISEHRFLEDTLDTGFDNGPVSLRVQPEQAEDYERAAREVASAALRDHPEKLLGACDRSRGSCRDALLDGFAPRAWRRPLAGEERARLASLWDDAASLLGPDEAITTTASAILQSPAFLYRSEVGEVTREGKVYLTPFEIAAELSYFLTGRGPDDALAAAASSGELRTADAVRRHATRLLATPAARAQVRHFFDAWLGTDVLYTVPKDPSLLVVFDPALRLAMRAELDAFYEHVVFDAEGSLAQLFGSTDGFVDDRLAIHYGHEARPGPSPTKVELGPARPGVLTRAGFLTSHAGYADSNPIVRGVFVRSALLCAPTPPPSGDAIRRLAEVIGARTTRERYAQHSNDPFCRGCHERIDGIGFGLEDFDAIGAARTTENGVAIDASGRLYDSGDGVDGPFVGGAELSRKLAKSPKVAACFVRQVFRFAMGRAEGPSDAQTLDALGESFGPRARIVDLLVELASSRAFRERAR